MIRPFHPSAILGVCLMTAFGLAGDAWRDATDETDGRAAAADRLFAEWDRPDSPGCALGVIQDGHLIHARGYGMANLDYGIRISPATVFDVGSVSKQFTTAVLVLLALDGKLSLDDDIRTHLPEMPDYGRPITIRHLIHHTSGIRDYLTLMSLAGMRFEDVHPAEELVTMLARQRALNFSPGDDYLYSNSGYFLLAVIAERVAGLPMGRLAAERIFEPLGMRNTRIFDDRTAIVPNRAIGYSPHEQGGFRVTYYPNFDVPGDGQVYTTVEDLRFWDRNFYTFAVGGRAFADEMLAPGRLNQGETLDYAGGLRVTTYRGLRTVGHGGSWAGYRADYLQFPEQNFSVACLCNLSTINPGQLARRVADIYLGDVMTPVVGSVEPAPVRVPLEDLARWTGAYRNPATAMVWRLVEDDGRLLARVQGMEVKLVPVGAARFHAEDPFEFEIAFGGDRRMTVSREGQKPEVYEPVTLVSPAPAELGAYAGSYHSEELDAVYRLAVEDGTLMLRRRNASPVALVPHVGGEFGAGPYIIVFDRQSAGAATGFAVRAGRVTGIRFVRQPD